MQHPYLGDAAVQRRRLGVVLRRVRDEAGLTQERLADQLGTSQSKISRLERGEQAAGARLIERWAALCDAPDELREELTERAERMAVQALAWRRERSRGLDHLQRLAGEFEQIAGTIRSFTGLLVPGLLQVPEYARRVFEAGHPEGDQDVDAAVAVRMNRQALLYSESTSFEFLITEAALRWWVGSASVMHSQIDRIEVVATLPNVTVGLLPLDTATEVWREHWFTLLDDRDDALGSVVNVETLTRNLAVTDPDEVRRYQEKFEALGKAAVFDDKARQVLDRSRAALTNP